MTRAFQPMTKLPVFFLLAFLVTGCASTNVYRNATTSDAATLTGMWRSGGMADWEYAAVRGVNDKYVPAPFFGRPGTATTKLVPGSHRILVYSSFNRTLLESGPFEAFLALGFQAEPQGSYRLQFKIRDNVIDAWVEDVLSGQVVSETSTEPFAEQARSVYAPVYVHGG
jgi:hypothetical protein